MFKYRLYPTSAQADTLEATLDICRELYNASLQERRDAYRSERKSIGYVEQAVQLPAIKASREDVASVHSQVLQDVLKRVEKAFDGFFRRVKTKQKAGFPRFRSRTRFDSFTFPQSGFSLREGKLRLSKIGHLKVKLHRPVKGRVKTCSLKREAGRWYVCFSVECDTETLPQRTEAVGIDVGLTAFATLSDGTEIKNPRYYRETERELRRAQRKVARRQRASNRRCKAVQLLQRVHAHIRNRRADFHHQMSRFVVNHYGLIGVEDLHLKGLAEGMLSKFVSDAGWRSFLSKTRYKAECAGRVFVEVDPCGTSQTCTCGARTPKRLSQRWHHCSECGWSASRDHVSAQVILKRALGLSVQASRWRAA